MSGCPHGSGWILVSIGLAACGGPDDSLPAVHDHVTRLGDLRFGMLPAQLEAFRPDGAYDDQGIYREGLDQFTVASYGFLPWVEGQPPSGRARLAGVEIREEVSDTAGLRELWMDAFDRTSAHASSNPLCWSHRAYRLRRWTAAFAGTIYVTLEAEAVETGDGREHDAYLAIRLETPEMAALSPTRGRREERGEPVTCPGEFP